MAPYAVFIPRIDESDAVVAAAQRWIGGHVDVANPVEEMVERSGIAPRTFKRRFKRATGLSPLQYVQALRVEAAKKRLEHGADPIEEIAWAVGYDNTAFFRRLFKRWVGVTPGSYRRMLRIPKPS